MSSTTWFSLRRRLLGLLLGGVSVCWVLTIVFSYFDALHEIDELFDAQLVQSAHTLLALSGDGEPEDVAELADLGHPYQKRLRFQVWGDGGQLLLRSQEAPTRPLTEIDGFSDGVEGQGNRWRYYGLRHEGRQVRVLVGESYHMRRELAMYIALRMLVPVLIGLPLLGLWVWIATRRGLEPLGAAAGQIASREPEHLDALALPAAPEEIRPLVDSINSLFTRVDQALESERRFTADAAHELRTPLAALAAQAQVALRARDEEERRHAIEQVSAGTRRAARLVDQLLTLARLDPDEAAPAEPVRLDRIAEEVCAAHGGAALDKRIDLELEAAPATVPGNADMLRILLRNLVDNAIRYTPGGGRVGVLVAANGAGTTLAISDTGPGIAPEDREQAFRRFHRLAGQETEGSGLGLSIVQRIADRHGARIDLGCGDGGRGLRVALSFPPAGTVTSPA